MSDAQQLETKTVQISAAAALTEATALAEYYRNRCMLLSNELHRLDEVARNQAVEIAQLGDMLDAAAGSTPAEEGKDPPAPPSMKRIKPKAKAQAAAPETVQ